MEFKIRSRPQKRNGYRLTLAGLPGTVGADDQASIQMEEDSLSEPMWRGKVVTSTAPGLDVTAVVEVSVSRDIATVTIMGFDH